MGLCGNMIIATLAYRCIKVSSFTFLIRFISKIMPYLLSTVLFIYSFLVCWQSYIRLNHRVVLLSHLPVTQHFGTAAYEIPNWAKWWYRTVWNTIYTSIFPIPVYRASLYWSQRGLSAQCSVYICTFIQLNKTPLKLIRYNIFKRLKDLNKNQLMCHLGITTSIGIQMHEELAWTWLKTWREKKYKI